MLSFSMFGSRTPRLSLPPLRFSVNFVLSALKSPHNRSSQFFLHAHQPNRFPSFPHIITTAHTHSPANSPTSMLWAHFPPPTPVGGPLNLLPIYSHPKPRPTPLPNLPITLSNATLTRSLATTHSKALAPKLSCLDATLTKNRGPHPSAHPVRSSTSLPHDALTSFSLHYCLRGTP
jgi:hypothetical protein